MIKGQDTHLPLRSGLLHLKESKNQNTCSPTLTLFMEPLSKAAEGRISWMKITGSCVFTFSYPKRTLQGPGLPDGNSVSRPLSRIMVSKGATFPFTPLLPLLVIVEPGGSNLLHVSPVPLSWSHANSQSVSHSAFSPKTNKHYM